LRKFGRKNEIAANYWSQIPKRHTGPRRHPGIKELCMHDFWRKKLISFLKKPFGFPKKPSVFQKSRSVSQKTIGFQQNRTVTVFLSEI
jgi:hypothetical protein